MCTHIIFIKDYWCCILGLSIDILYGKFKNLNNGKKIHINRIMEGRLVH